MQQIGKAKPEPAVVQFLKPAPGLEEYQTKINRKEALLLINDWMRMKTQGQDVAAVKLNHEFRRDDQPAGQMWTMIEAEKLEKDIDRKVEKEGATSAEPEPDPWQMKYEQKPMPDRNLERDWEIVPVQPLTCNFCRTTRLQVATCSLCKRYVCWLCIDKHRGSDECIIAPHMSKTRGPAEWKFGQGWKRIKGNPEFFQMESGVWSYYERTDDEEMNQESDTSDDEPSVIVVEFDDPRAW